VASMAALCHLASSAIAYDDGSLANHCFFTFVAVCIMLALHTHSLKNIHSFS
jgi:hypothetical protein